MFEKLIARYHDCETKLAQFLTIILPLLTYVVGIAEYAGELLEIMPDGWHITTTQRVVIIFSIESIKKLAKYLPPPKKDDTFTGI